jgi:hypothetical protein
MVFPQDPSAPAGEFIAFIPALISAVICAGLIRSGFLTPFFLVPLGVVAVKYNVKTRV